MRVGEREGETQGSEGGGGATTLGLDVSDDAGGVDLSLGLADFAAGEGEDWDWFGLGFEGLRFRLSFLQTPTSSRDGSQQLALSLSLFLTTHTRSRIEEKTSLEKEALGLFIRHGIYGKQVKG
ncbi:hypothetical protein CMV_020505 [Castanea mollissima]|uniref:Uncharacterized protein n=1 Tax=Castanea mollissima TaxID=60419 RepID=A0A8J4QHL5_9ROSI|nr:hypothetical protein CMV_020505 [Castanea mollissima]